METNSKLSVTPFAFMLKFAGVVLCCVSVLFFMTTGCENQNTVPDKGKDTYISEDTSIPEAPDDRFCLCATEKNLDETIPVMNEYVSNLRESLTGELKIISLGNWLSSQPCVSDAHIDYSSVKMNPLTGEIHIRFKGDGFSDGHKSYIMDFLCEDAKTVTVTGVRDMLDEHEKTEKEDWIDVPSTVFPVRSQHDPRIYDPRYWYDYAIAGEYYYSRSDAGYKNLVVINSNDSLVKKITCYNDVSYPGIDFVNKTFIMACGVTDANTGSGLLRGIIYLKRYQFSEKYTVNADFYGCPGGNINLGLWNAAIIVDKLPYDINIEICIHLFDAAEYKLIHPDYFPDPPY